MKNSILIILVATLMSACSMQGAGMEPEADAGTQDAGTFVDVTIAPLDVVIVDATVDASPDAEPTNCGNSVLDPAEECDGLNLGGQDCTDYGFFTGTLSCNQDCTIDTQLCEEEPEICGDGIVQSQEACDPGDNPDCYPDCSGYCGDGLVHNGVVFPDHGEECDGLADCTPICTVTTCGDGYCTPSEGNDACVVDCGCTVSTATECGGDCCEGVMPGSPGECCSDNTCVVFTDLGLGGVQNCGGCGNTCPAGSQCTYGSCN